MDVKQAQMDSFNQDMEPEVQPAKTRPRWRGSATTILACLGGGSLLIGAALAWGYWQFGSLSSTLAYLRGERLLLHPGTVSFGTARRGEERELHLIIQNWTGKEVKILGAKSSCGCMGIGQKFPFSITDRGRHKLTIQVKLAGTDSVFEKRVDFYTDDEVNPVIGVVVRGTIAD